MTWPVLSASATTNLTAPAFDVKYRFFSSAADFAALTDLANFTEGALPTGWTANGTGNDTLTPSGTWTEIAGENGEVLYDGKLERAQNGATVGWSVTLRGFGHSTALLGRGLALVCLRRIRRRAFDANAAYDSGWKLWWLGIISRYDTTQTYQAGGAWSVEVSDVSEALRYVDAPRLVASPINIATGSSVAASSTLATPASEVGNLEFVGVSASVVAGNVVDGRKSTVWISQNPPTVTEDASGTATFSMWTANEVMAWPVAGYSNLNAWWVEILNTSDLGWIENQVYFVTRNQANELVTFPIPGALASGERGIICGDVQIFEAMTGGAKNCKWVISAREQGAKLYLGESSGVILQGAGPKDVNLNPTNGWVGLITNNRGNAFKWGNPVMDNSPSPAYYWGAGGYVVTGSITGMQPGYSLRRKPAGTSTSIVDPYPRPGALKKWTTDVPEYIKIELPAQGALLSANAAAGATTLTLSDTVGWPEPVAGQTMGGIVNTEKFQYATRTTTQLQGVATLAHNHYIGEAAFPLFPTSGAQSEAMTGWPLSTIEITRLPGRSKIKRGEVYVSRYANRDTPNLADKTDVVWRTDYDLPPMIIDNGILMDDGTTSISAQDTLTFPIGSRACPWVRSILILIHEMWDGGRAKVNEVRPYLDLTAINDSPAAQIGVTKSASLAEYVLETYADLAGGVNFGTLGGGRFVDETPVSYGVIGRMALAVAPLPGVLDDLARTTGCIVEWTLDGRVKWWPDPFWPGGPLAPGPEATFTANTWRGDLTYDDSAEPVLGIGLTAQSTAGDPLERVIVPPGTTGSGVIEVTGYTVVAGREQILAETIYRQAINQQRLMITLTGVGEEIRPLHRYAVQGPSGESLGTWYADSVVTSWAHKERIYTHTVAVSLRKYLA